MQLRRLSLFSKIAFCSLSALLLLAGSVFAQENEPLDLPSDYETISAYDKLNVDELRSTAQREGSVRLIVGFDMDTYTGNDFTRMADPDQTRQISRAQTTLFSTLSAANVTASNVKTYDFLPYVAMTVDAAGVDALKNSPLVNYIQLDGLNKPILAQSTGVIRASGTGGAWAKGYDGSGVTVAVMDTGVLKTHPFLSGKVKAEACFGTNQTFYDPVAGTIPVNSNCPGGVTTSTANNSALPCSSSIYGCDHGTHVAGIVAGDGASFDGVARGADLLAIQVFSRVNNALVCDGDPTCILAFDSDMIGGLNWVYSQRKNYEIAAVNVSIGGGRYSSQSTCNAQNKAMKSAIDKLRGAKIAVVVASGNEFYSNELASPACISSAISVGATTKSDSVAAFSNSTNFLDLLAPGVSINSSVLANAYEPFDGTSMAAPHVAGAWAILRQNSPNANVDKIEKALKKTGVKITDSRQGRKTPRINVSEALLFLTNPDKPVLTAPAADFTTNASSTTFTWNAAANATEYKIVVKSPSGAKIVKQKATSAAACSGSTCSYIYSGALGENGKYTWFVQARNEYNKKKSDKRTLIAAYPGKANLSTPANNASVASPTQFVWTAVSGATEYKLVVKDLTKGGKVLKVKNTSAALCASSCAYGPTSTELSAFKSGREYQWFVQAISSAGKVKSDKYKFTITAS